MSADEAAEAGYSGENEAVGDAFSGSGQAGQFAEEISGNAVNPAFGADTAVQPAESQESFPVSSDELPAAGGEEAVFTVEPAPTS